MNAAPPLPPVAIVAAMFAITLGVPIGLYRLLTVGRRRTMREIRRSAGERGWRYRVRHWMGDPTAIRIDGRTASGLNWTLTTESAGHYVRDWSVQLALRIADLAGEMDFAILPRDPAGPGAALLGPAMAPRVESRVAALSGVAANAVAFFRNARELPAGVSQFDAAYEVLGLPGRIGQPPVDRALAERILNWPPEAIAPQAVFAWRDPFGFHGRARLTETPNWATVSHFLSVAEDLIGRIPAPVAAAVPQGSVDRAISRFLS